MLIGLSTSFLRSPERSCQMLKYSMFQLINVYKNMGHDQREDLYENSMRQFTYAYLTNILYQDDGMKPQISQNISQAREALQKYDKYAQYQANDILKQQKKLTKKMNDLMPKWNQKKQTYDSLSANLVQRKQNLDIIKKNLMADPEFKGNFDQHEKIAKFNSMFDFRDTASNSDVDMKNNLEYLTELREGLKPYMTNEESGLFKVYNKGYAQAAEAYDMISEFNKNEANFLGNVQTEGLNEAAQNLRVGRENFLKSTEMANAKNVIFQMINTKWQNSVAFINNYSTNKENHQSYAYFRALLNEGKKMIPQLLQSKIDFNKVNQELKNIQGNLDALNWKDLRVKSNDFMKVKEQYYNTKEFTNMIYKKMTEEQMVDIQLEAEQLLDQYSASTTSSSRLQEFQANNTYFEGQHEALKQYKEQSKIIDAFFGRVFASLQGGVETSESFKCLTLAELSIIFYYANLFQIITKWTKFLEEFFKYMPEQESVIIMKNLFYDLKGYGFQDHSIFDNSQTYFAEDGLGNGIKLYTVFLSTELDEVFEHQIKLEGKGLLYRKMMSVLKYAGYEFKYITKDVIKKSLKKVFIAIAGALVVLLHVISIAVILTGVILMIILFILKIIIEKIGQNLSKGCQIMKDFAEGVNYLISQFLSDKKTESLNFKSLLDTYQSQIENKNSIDEPQNPKWKEHSQEFKLMFDELLGDQSLEKIDRQIEVYENWVDFK